MKKILIIILLLIICGCTKREDIPKYVIEDVENYMSEHYEVKIEEYTRIETSEQAEKYGLSWTNEDLEDDDIYVYKFKTEDFEFYTYNYTAYGAITVRSQSIFTNITAVLYKKNLDSIKKIANKYNIKVVDNLPTTTFSWNNDLEIDLSGVSKTDTESFLQELLTISDIKKLVELKYDKYQKEDGTTSYTVSGWDEDMIQDYSSVEGYYDTEFFYRSSLLNICAREYYKS